MENEIRGQTTKGAVTLFRFTLFFSNNLLRSLTGEYGMAWFYRKDLQGEQDFWEYISRDSI